MRPVDVRQRGHQVQRDSIVAHRPKRLGGMQTFETRPARAPWLSGLRLSNPGSSWTIRPGVTPPEDLEKRDVEP
jgi:hypothetical protein